VGEVKLCCKESTRAQEHLTAVKSGISDAENKNRNKLEPDFLALELRSTGELGREK
jgi:hypothetical protein